jgi:hypothetical protein
VKHLLLDFSCSDRVYAGVVDACEGTGALLQLQPQQVEHASFSLMSFFE